MCICQPQSPNSSHHHHRPAPPLPPWCPYVCSLHLCLYFCPANRFICTIFLGSTYNFDSLPDPKSKHYPTLQFSSKAPDNKTRQGIEHDKTGKHMHFWDRERECRNDHTPNIVLGTEWMADCWLNLWLTLIQWQCKNDLSTCLTRMTLHVMQTHSTIMLQ